MGFYEDNLRMIESIRRDVRLQEHLLAKLAMASKGPEVGDSTGAKRRFYSTGAYICGVPLGLKIGENECIGIEAATIEFLHDNVPELQPLLPRIFGIIPSPQSQGCATIVMEDFSDNGQYRIRNADRPLEELLRLGTYRSEAEKATFIVEHGTQRGYRIGDLDSLYATLNQYARDTITEILLDKYDDIRILSVV